MPDNMHMTAVERLHHELDFDVWKEQLQSLKGIWAQIQDLQRKAKTAAGLQRYRAYLERCLHNLKTKERELKGAELEEAERTLATSWQFETDLLADKISFRRPQGIEEYCQKWLPRVAEDFALAKKAWHERKTQRHFERYLEEMQNIIHQFSTV